MGLECKSRKSRNTWSNRQIWPGSTEWSKAKANRVLPRELTGHSKHPFPTTQGKTHTWTSPDGQHWNQIDYILWSQRWKSCIQSAKTRPGADCGSDHELLIAKFGLELKKVGKTKDLQDLLELTPKKDVLFIIGDWNAKVGSQETLE